MVTLSTRDVLLQQRLRCLDKLRKLSTTASGLVTELESLDMALSNLPTPSGAQYSGFRFAIDAIAASLAIYDRPMTADELAKDVTAGGWLSKDNRAYWNVMDSIDYHTRRKGRGQKKNIIRALNGLIGLYDWPDEKFAVEQPDNVSS